MDKSEIFNAIEPILMTAYSYRNIDIFDEDTPLYYNFELDNDIEGVHPSKQVSMKQVGVLNLYKAEDSFPNSSYAAMNVIMEVEDMMGIEIDDVEAAGVTTVGELLDLIKKKIG